MKRPYCPKCKPGWLIKKYDTTPYDGPLEVVSCLLCGWRVWKPERGVPVNLGKSKRRQVAEAEFSRLTGEL